MCGAAPTLAGSVPSYPRTLPQRDGPAVTAAEGTGTAAACSVRNAAIGMASARRCCGHQTNRNALLEPSRRAVPGKGARSPFNCRQITSPLPALWICPPAHRHVVRRAQRHEGGHARVIVISGRRPTSSHMEE